MATKGSQPEKIFIKVLWGDTELGEVSRRFSSVRGVSAGRSLFADLHSKIWPLREDLVILERENGRVFLNAAIPWHGMIASGDTIHILDPRKPKRKTFEIKKNTVATLRYEDVTIALRVGHAHKKQAGSAAAKGKFRAPALGLIADSKNEQIALGISIVASAFLILAVVAGLKKREVWRPETIADISDDLKLPFMSPDHFTTAPNILQDRLDRFDYVSSVTAYYSDFVETLTSGENFGQKPQVFDQVHSNYKQMIEEQSQTLNRFQAASEKLKNDTLARGERFVSIPVIRGESLDGSMQRILDKASLISTYAAELIDSRAITGEAFNSDPVYDFGVRAATTDDALADFTKKLGEGFRKELPDEKQQLAEAKGFAVRTSAAQIELFGKEHLISGIHNCCGTLVGISPGSTPIAYASEPDFSDSDRNLAALKASIWGEINVATKKSKIIEPMSGSIDERAVEKSIAQGRFQLQLCFELALRRNQSAKGTMEWQWQIDTKGKLSQLYLVNSTLKDQELIQCVRKRIASWKFPKPKGGSVEIRYPFEFSRDKG